MTQPHIFSHLIHFISSLISFLISHFSIRWPPTRLSARLSLAIPHIRVAIRPAQLSRSHNPTIPKSHPFHSQSHFKSQFSFLNTIHNQISLSQFSSNHNFTIHLNITILISTRYIPFSIPQLAFKTQFYKSTNLYIITQMHNSTN